MARILDLNNTGTIPQTFASGSWPITAFNAGKFGFTWSPSLASTDSSWRPTGTAFGFWCIFGTQGEPNGSGIWLEYVVATQVHSIVFVRTLDGNVIVGARVPITWGANQAIRIVGDMQSASANAASLTVSGALTGNTSAAFTRETILAAGTLEYGRWNGSFTLLASTISDVDDTVAGTVERTIGVTLAPTFAASAQQTSVRTIGISLASGWEATAQSTGGAVQRSVNVALVPSWVSAAQQTHQRQLGISTVSSWSATAFGGLFSRGAFGSARVLYGTAAGTVSVTLTTAASGSTVLACVGGRLADLATAMTDSRGNAWTLLYTEEYARWPGYGIRVYRCIGLSGGAGHVFSQQYGQTAGFDECSIAVYEQRGAAHIESTSMVERAIGTSVATGSVTAQALCAWVVFLSGDAPTGATAVLTPSNGLAILDQSTGIDDPNGYVPLVILAADKPSGSYASTVGITPSQGAIIFAAAIQAQAVVERVIGITLSPTLAATASQVHIRAFGVSPLPSWAAAAQGTTQRVIGVTLSMGWVANAGQTSIRSMTITLSTGWATNATQAWQRAVSISGLPEWATNATQRWQRAVSISGLPEWTAVGEGGPVPGLVQRDIHLQVIPSWSASGFQTHNRELTVTASSGWAISSSQTHIRSIGARVGLIQWAISIPPESLFPITLHTLVGYKTGEYQVHRPGETSIVNGRAVRPPPTILMMGADIQPATGRLLRNVPEGVETEDIRIVFTDFELRVGTRPDGTNRGREPDLVMINDEPWRVIKTAHYNVISGHYQATIQRRWHS